MPLPNEQLLDALPLVPGVVRGPDGQINMNGARASQSAMTVNSANVTDPVTGDFAINLPIEAIESAQVLTNPYAAEYGKFTGGVTAVETRSGADKFNFDAAELLSRVCDDAVANGPASKRSRHGLTVSGPIKKNKLWFMQSFEYRFVRTPVYSLPPDKRDTGLESFDSVHPTRLGYQPQQPPHQHLLTVSRKTEIRRTQHLQSRRGHAQLQTARFLLGGERTPDDEQ